MQIVNKIKERKERKAKAETLYYKKFAFHLLQKSCFPFFQLLAKDTSDYDFNPQGRYHYFSGGGGGGGAGVCKQFILVYRACKQFTSVFTALQKQFIS